MTPESLAAVAQLRRGDHFEWHLVSALAFVVYVYASAARRREWDRVALGLGFWSLELVWEMMNALVLHFSGHAALWTVAGRSALVVYVGLNAEISLMFAVVPMVLFHLLAGVDRRWRLGRLPVRALVPIGLGLFCVMVESGLNRLGVLVWAWPFWRWPHLELVALAYCAPLAGLAWVHDHLSLRVQIRGAAAAVALAGGAHFVLAERLGWV